MPPVKRPTAPKAKPKPSRTSKAVTDTIARDDKGSRAKAETSHNRAAEQEPESGPPLAADGRPLTMIEMSAAELIPTGQYANISVGPARVRAWIDPRDDDPLPESERANIAKALNQLGDLVEIDVIAVQRNLTLESMQDQTEPKK